MTIYKIGGGRALSILLDEAGTETSRDKIDTSKPFRVVVWWNPWKRGRRIKAVKRSKKMFVRTRGGRS